MKINDMADAERGQLTAMSHWMHHVHAVVVRRGVVAGEKWRDIPMRGSVRVMLPPAPLGAVSVTGGVLPIILSGLSLLQVLQFSLTHRLLLFKRRKFRVESVASPSVSSSPHLITNTTNSAH